MHTLPDLCLVGYQPKTVLLRDGTPIQIRAVRPDDTPRLLEMHSRLSDYTIHLRYLGLTRLNYQQAEALCTIDYQQEMRLVATRTIDDEEIIIGETCYMTLDKSDLAEFAILIEDAYQGRGLGKHLFRELITYARLQGVQTFLVITNYENRGMLSLVRHCGLPYKAREDCGIWEIYLKLHEEAQIESLKHAA